MFGVYTRSDALSKATLCQQQRQERDCQSEGFRTVGLCIACTFLKFTAQDCESRAGANLVQCDLTGSIPSEIGLLTNLVSLIVAYTGLTGSIPSELGKLSNIVTLALISNTLTGSIPSELGNSSVTS